MHLLISCVVQANEMGRRDATRRDAAARACRAGQSRGGRAVQAEQGRAGQGRAWQGRQNKQGRQSGGAGIRTKIEASTKISRFGTQTILQTQPYRFFVLIPEIKTMYLLIFFCVQANETGRGDARRISQAGQGRQGRAGRTRRDGKASRAGIRTKIKA